MAAGRRVRRQAYVYGSLAPSAAMPRPEWEERQQKANRLEQQTQQYQRMRRRVRRNQEKALQMDLPYVLMLTVAAVFALYICVGYLHVQSSITGRIHNIEVLEQKLERLKSENDSLETRINTDMDLDHIYEVATKELGMVYANKDQVILYDKTESEYVRQYEDIPKHQY